MEHHRFAEARLEGAFLLNQRNVTSIYFVYFTAGIKLLIHTRLMHNNKYSERIKCNSNIWREYLYGTCEFFFLYLLKGGKKYLIVKISRAIHRIKLDYKIVIRDLDVFF